LLRLLEDAAEAAGKMRDDGPANDDDDDGRATERSRLLQPDRREDAIVLLKGTVAGGRSVRASKGAVVQLVDD
jgi:hypothetical protein